MGKLECKQSNMFLGDWEITLHAIMKWIEGLHANIQVVVGIDLQNNCEPNYALNSVYILRLSSYNDYDFLQVLFGATCLEGTT